MDLQISVWVYTHRGYKQEGLHREIKMTHIDFAFLNSHVTVIYLRFIKNTYFYVEKENNLKSKSLYISVLFILIYDLAISKQENV